MEKPAKILYFDCVSGISGDMCLGALIDLGVGLDIIEEGLKGLALTGFSLSLSREKRFGIEGARLVVVLDGESPERSWADIRALITESALLGGVKELSLEIFSIIAEAEAKVHGVATDEVRFHEIGAIDSIVDIVGVAIAIDSLDIDEVYTSAIPLGEGLVDTAHGPMPVPAPATMEILKGVEIKPSRVKAELTTPTGAAIIKALSKGTRSIPAMSVSEIGYGIGSKDFKEAPNLLRLLYGEGTGDVSGDGQVVVVETNLDDLSPQIAGYLMDSLFEAGALDVCFTPVQMKKSRPGLLLTAIVEEDSFEAVTETIFVESSSIGLRFHRVGRRTLERKEYKLDTRFGKITIKASSLDGRVVTRKPEFEELKAAAKKSGLPLKSVRDEVMALLREDNEKTGAEREGPS